MKELIKSLEQLTTFYITEKGQLMASFAKTISSERPKEAIEQFQEALKFEPHHVGLLRELSRNYLSQRDCSKAAPHIKQLEALNPFSAENKLLVLQEMECAGEFEALAAKLNSREAEPDVEGYIRPLLVSESLHRKDTKRVTGVLVTWETLDAKDPELHRWKWVASLAVSKPDRSAGETYLRLCRALTPASRQKYSLNPVLCRNVDQVTKEMQQYGAEPGDSK